MEHLQGARRRHPRSRWRRRGSPLIGGLIQSCRPLWTVTSTRQSISSEEAGQLRDLKPHASLDLRSAAPLGSVDWQEMRRMEEALQSHVELGVAPGSSC